MGLFDLVGDVVIAGCDIVSDVTDFAFDTAETVYELGSELTDVISDLPVKPEPVISSDLAPIDLGFLTSSLMSKLNSPRIKPKRGSIVFAKIFPVFEHSGVYIGDDEIVELTMSGEIRKTRAKGFTEGIVYGEIYIACQGDEPIHLESIANKAESCIGSYKDYNMATENCHRFTAACITGDFQNVNVLFTFLNLLIVKEFGGFEWRRCQLG